MATIFFLDIYRFLGPSLKSSFSELRRSWELCFGYVSGLGSKNRNLMWISEISGQNPVELQSNRSLSSDGVERTDFVREMFSVVQGGLQSVRDKMEIR